MPKATRVAVGILRGKEFESITYRISYVTETFEVILFWPVGMLGAGEAAAPPRLSAAIDISAFA